MTTFDSTEVTFDSTAVTFVSTEGTWETTGAGGFPAGWQPGFGGGIRRTLYPAGVGGAGGVDVPSFGGATRRTITPDGVGGDGGVGQAIVRGEIRPVGRRTVRLVSASGADFPLDGSRHVYASRGLAVHGGPPVVVASQPTLGMQGEVVQSVRHAPWPVNVPVWIAGDRVADANGALRALVAATNPLVGPVRVVVGQPDGSERELVALYTAGLDSIPVEWAGSTNIGTSDDPLNMVLTAFDPYWRSVSEFERGFTTELFTLPEGEATPSNAPISSNAPIPSNGITDAGVQVFGIDVGRGDPGAVDAWPVWEFEGPGAEIEATNLTTGELFRYQGAALTVDERLYVDAWTPIVRIDRRVGDTWIPGRSVHGYLDDYSTLFPLVPGPNRLAVQMTGVTSGSSRIRVRWRERFLSC